MEQEPIMPRLRGLGLAGVRFVSDGSNLVVNLAPAVLSHLQLHRQTSDAATEAGGQLFARFTENTIAIEKATGPRRSDRRTVWSFLPDRLAERREINALFKQGLHFVGDWHTHPQAQPAPSGRDIASFLDMFKKSHHELSDFVMIIVGTEASVSGLFVALVNGKRLLALQPAPPQIMR
ncbi:MAG: Mov34/MPN/PAD-1 family protein [Rhodospirillaceae bacterium]